MCLNQVLFQVLPETKVETILLKILRFAFIVVIIKTRTIHVVTYWQYTRLRSLFATLLTIFSFKNHYISLYFYLFLFQVCLLFMLHHLTAESNEKGDLLLQSACPIPQFLGD